MQNKTLTENIAEFLYRNGSRRSFIRNTMFSAAGASLGSLASTDIPYAAPLAPGISTVSFVTGSDRRDMMYQVLKPLEKEIKDGIKGKQVVIKPNLVGPDELCAPHADAVRGVLDFLKPIYKKKVIVGDSTGRVYPCPMGTWKHFELHKYLTLPKEYNMKLIDLNDQPTKAQWILDNNCHPSKVNIIDTFLYPNNYIISLTRLKTHGRGVVVTLGMKNIIMGSPISHYRQKKAEGRNEKSLMHSGGHENLNFNMFLIAQKVHADLSVLDGLVGMEGNGPTQGTAVEHGVAVAGTDLIAVDKIGTVLMGVDFNEVQHMKFCADAGMGQSDISKIKIIGPNPTDYVINYRMNDNILNQS